MNSVSAEDTETTKFDVRTSDEVYKGENRIILERERGRGKVDRRTLKTIQIVKVLKVPFLQGVGDLTTPLPSKISWVEIKNP